MDFRHSPLRYPSVEEQLIAAASPVKMWGCFRAYAEGVKLPLFPRLQAMAYRSGCHTTFHHRYHLVWAPKYRYKVLIGDVRLRVREIIRQVCEEMGVTIVNGALSRDHVHMFVEIPPHVSVSDFVRRAKGRSSRKIQQEFEHIRKRYWGQRF
jgi:putative transposase